LENDISLLALTLREGHRLNLFQSRVLRRIFGPKREKAADGKKIEQRLAS
jgi:hypothetical protein